MHLFFFSPSVGQLVCFRLKFKCSLRKAAYFFFICKARLQCVITMPNWERAFFPSQVGCVMGIFPFALSLFLGRISLIAVQTGWGFFASEKEDTSRRQRCSPRSAPLFKILVPAPNFACKETRSARGTRAPGWTRSGSRCGGVGLGAPSGAAASLWWGFAEERPRSFPSLGQGSFGSSRQGQRQSLEETPCKKNPRHQ